MMLSLVQPNHLIELAKKQLVSALIQYKQKPYLPVWGELFTALRDIAKYAHQLQENVMIYAIQPCGCLWYHYKEKRFMVDVPEPGITIFLTQEQLMDALLQGSFAPSKSQ